MGFYDLSKWKGPFFFNKSYYFTGCKASILGAFEKLLKATVNFITCVCQYVRLHVITRFLLEDFYGIVFQYFSKICREKLVSRKSDKSDGYFACSSVYVCDNIGLSSC